MNLISLTRLRMYGIIKEGHILRRVDMHKNNLYDIETSRFKKTLIVKSICIVMIIFMVTLLAFSLKFSSLKSTQVEYETVLEDFDLDYLNNSNSVIKIRYRYVLNYETADISIPENWDYSFPLFSLYKDGLLVHQAYLVNDTNVVIPEVSETYTLKPKESIKSNFEIRVNKQAQSFQDMVRFEVNIKIEELKEDKWAPVHQAVFMERGPYWSLNKGPIEFIKD